MLTHEAAAILPGAAPKPDRPLRHGRMDAGPLARATVADLVLPQPHRPDTPTLTMFEPAGQYQVRLDPGGRYLVQMRGLRPRSAAPADGMADG